MPENQSRPVAQHRRDYALLERITTRWSDNDAYRHVNNVVYYSFFDTAVNRMLIAAGLLDIENSAVIGLVVETRCQYFRPLSFPDDVWSGLRVAHLGRSSIRYDIALFRQDDGEAAAQGSFTHVTVDRASNRPVPIPDAHRRHLQTLVMPNPAA